MFHIDKCTKLFDYNQNEIPDQVGDDGKMAGDDGKMVGDDCYLSISMTSRSWARSVSGKMERSSSRKKVTSG